MKPYYQTPRVTIYNDDCLAVLPLLRRRQVDHIITDPPYSPWVHSKSRMGANAPTRKGNGRDATRSAISRARTLGFEALTDDVRQAAAAEFAALARRWVLVFSDVESCHLWRRDLENAGLEYIRTGAWHKVGATPQFTGDRPAAAFEAITICHPHYRKIWNAHGKHAIWSVPIVLNRNGREPRLHTTQKPEDLMRDLVDDFTSPNDVVLDAFMGSGTTLVAAIARGRRVIGIERRKADCDKAIARLEAL